MRCSRSADERPLRILQSFTISRTTNPYFAQLVDSVPEVNQRSFTWRAAIFSQYDVLHIHFPDVLFVRARRVRALAAGILFASALVRARMSGIAIVRTAHNLAPHEERGWLVNRVVSLSERWTTLWILLNAQTPVRPRAAFEVIPHGHYSDWFERDLGPRVEPRSMLYFGLIRPYKGVESLLVAFADLDDDDARLKIVGRTSNEALRSAIISAQRRDPRISVTLEYVDDDRLAQTIQRSNLVILPYTVMHNSGAVLLSLSLGRPVLVPANEVTDALANEVGHWWVRRFDPPLTGADLSDALDAVAGSKESGGPDLSGRSWDVVGRLHHAAYHRAVELARCDRHKPRSVTHPRPYSK